MAIGLQQAIRGRALGWQRGRRVRRRPNRGLGLGLGPHGGATAPGQRVKLKPRHPSDPSRQGWIDRERQLNPAMPPRQLFPQPPAGGGTKQPPLRQIPAQPTGDWNREGQVRPVAPKPDSAIDPRRALIQRALQERARDFDEMRGARVPGRGLAIGHVRGRRRRRLGPRRSGNRFGALGL